MTACVPRLFRTKFRSMKIAVWVVAAMTLCACGRHGSQDAGAVDSGVRDDAGTSDGGCACIGVCCHECSPVIDGTLCDDRLQCTTTSSCTAGSCIATSQTCTVAEPQCQARACDELTGCGATMTIREGFPCDDGDAGTIDDHCDNGACVGTPVVFPGMCDSGRFTVTANTALDSTTGLTWGRDQSLTRLNWNDADGYCSGDGWRLPTIDELLTIHNGTADMPHASACAFPATSASFFWSSTASEIAGSFKMLDFGGCCSATSDAPDQLHWVRCVK